MWLDETTLPALARGCAVLGAGGGGSADVGLLAARQAVQDHGPVRVVGLDELDDDGLIMPCGMLGAPTVMLEKIGNGNEGHKLRETIEAEVGRPVVAMMCVEIGGTNGLDPVCWAARLRLPMVDADGMGRAFPEVQQVSMFVHGIPATPSVVVDERGHTVVFRDSDGVWLERMSRSVAVACGGIVTQADHTMTVAQARHATIPGSVSLAIRIGQVLTTPVDDPVESLLKEMCGLRIMDGKVVDVERRIIGGFVRGAAIVEGLQGDADRMLRIEIQNENLVALEDGVVVASVPDIITMLDTQTGDAIPTELLRYGQRVTVIALPCAPIWRTPAGLAVAGPRAFGYDFDYHRVEAPQ